MTVEEIVYNLMRIDVNIPLAEQFIENLKQEYLKHTLLGNHDKAVVKAFKYVETSLHEVQEEQKNELMMKVMRANIDKERGFFK